MSKPKSNRSYPIAPETVRRVWAQLTQTPTATVVELVASTGLSHQTMQQAINRLVALGYVERNPGIARGRRVVMPFFTATVQRETRPPHWDRTVAA